MSKTKKKATLIVQPEPVVKPSKSKKPVKNLTTAKPQKKAVLPEKPRYRQGTKQDILITMLKRSTGATVDEMAEAVGWQKHSVLGMIHGILRKRLGMEAAASQEERGRVYRIAGGR